ncbi:selenocysteine-specific translation elongation factor [Methylococcus sp. EFPC2]|uniref:selenocysteine-specific translation elongation factor n=1 Tax=Methylococcus sp. EFPC2 TaxID=2812648 RepID=UPI0019689319|nr:selenocysteine-specific translation elongation factor [Methylococcus sp. EFPC2]QSA96163.1 selenocysteine-specific translation elongation factor [Methylococcus sp. EFPC2]
MIVGTAGHIDHGKTALVKALTGVDADRLAEEKARGITIDLGYAYTPLANGDILGFVDVPGHERFIHNMLAGVTGIDFALLVVAADDGPMPQTLEHLQILDLLGIRRGAVALTKTDLVEADRIAEVAEEICVLLEGTELAGSPVFPVSAVTGSGMAELRAHLETAAQNLGERTGRSAIEIRNPLPLGEGRVRVKALDISTISSRTSSADALTPTPLSEGEGLNSPASTTRGGCFRFAIDRCFTVAGAGTVVTGTVFSGRVAVGDKLLLSPSGRPVRVRGIHAQNRPAEMGLVGQRCALNLADVDKQQVQRGDWVLAPELHLPTTRLDVRLKLLAGEAHSLKHWTPVHVHLGAFHATGRVALLRDEPLQPGDSALAQLVLDKPTCAVHGDRFVLRDASALHTLAGGWVLDAQPPQRGRRSVQRLDILSTWELPAPKLQLQALLAASPNGVDLRAFAANANLTAAEMAGLRQNLELSLVEGTKPLAFAPDHWAALRQAVIETLRKEHEDVPDSLGLNAEQLRLRAAPRLDRAAFAQVLAELLEDGECARDGSWWHLPGHRITLSESDEALWQRIAPLLLEQPFQPPRVRDIARAEALEEAAVRKLLIQVACMGQVYKVAHDHYFDRTAVAQLADIVRDLARQAPDGAVAAAEFRDRIATGRKLAIHILEYFDRIGLTRRLGDAHRLRNHGLQL